MAQIFNIRFEDFKLLVSDRRIYFFESDFLVDLYFSFEDVIIKSSLVKSEIESPEAFFSHRMFSGAIRLLVNIDSDDPLRASFAKSIGSGISIPLNKFPENVDGDLQRSEIDDGDS